MVDDFTRLTSYVNRTNAKAPNVPIPVKNALQAGELNSMGFSNTSPQGVLSDLYTALNDMPVDPHTSYTTSRLFNNAVDNAGWRGNRIAEVPNTDWLGHGRVAEFDSWDGPRTYVLPEDGVSVRIPELPLDTLVQSGSTRRPHKNTALGRWFERIKNDPARLYNDSVRDIVSTTSMSDEAFDEFVRLNSLPF